MQRKLQELKVYQTLLTNKTSEINEESLIDFQRTGSDSFADGAELRFAIFSGGTSLSDFSIKVSHLRQ